MREPEFASKSYSPVPAEMARVAQAAFPKGNRSLQMRDGLGTLAHTLLMWVRRWLAQASPQHTCRWQQYGIKRIVRDVAHIGGSFLFDKHRRLQVSSCPRPLRSPNACLSRCVTCSLPFPLS